MKLTLNHLALDSASINNEDLIKTLEKEYIRSLELTGKEPRIVITDLLDNEDAKLDKLIYIAKQLEEANFTLPKNLDTKSNKDRFKDEGLDRYMFFSDNAATHKFAANPQNPSLLNIKTKGTSILSSAPLPNIEISDSSSETSSTSQDSFELGETQRPSAPSFGEVSSSQKYSQNPHALPFSMFAKFEYSSDKFEPGECWKAIKAIRDEAECESQYQKMLSQNNSIGQNCNP
jgi:hypothetical protein